MLRENEAQEKKRQMSLAEIFLQQKGKETNSISISRGLEFTRKELFRNLKNYAGECLFEYFFDKANEPQAEFYELMDLWEAIKEYIPLLKEQDRKRYSNLFDLIYEMDGHYYCFQYWKLREKMGGLFEERLTALCQSIEKICNSKQINIMDQNMNLKYKISLENFAGYINDFNYMHIKHCLAETMIAVVVAGPD